MDMLALLLSNPLYLALLMLLAGSGALIWPALSGGERSDLKRRLRVERAQMSAGDAVKPASSLLRRRAEKTAREFYARTDPENVARLRLRLIQAGFMDPHAVGAFFLIRFLCLAAAGLIALVIAGVWGAGSGGNIWLFAGVAAIIGYFAPGLVLSRLVQLRVIEHRNGFPDFMDLMIVCSDAGMSMEASIERVSRELALTYPSLSRNLQLITIELRAGRGLEDCLRSLADRLSLEEVRSFATLLQQSRELGTSLSGALRVFSDEMRHKRMSLAEEKAHALPAKMSIPVTVCILPVVLMVAIIPIIVKMTTE